ncbi:hypothetical protein BOTCAL_0128g00180 [Botryotinia calthae]|uniref:Uncharacterized protein n=1 Tax=Botryotinia calthae TaxID=38488 RepID=A0A4Y8D4K6_9HELO|nr:hypothetical protein BOTCAL_0128g00180 [Botryotinia calthae]
MTIVQQEQSRIAQMLSAHADADADAVSSTKRCLNHVDQVPSVTWYIVLHDFPGGVRGKEDFRGVAYFW